MRRRVSAISHLTCNWCHKDASHAICLESSSYISYISFALLPSLQLLVEQYILETNQTKLADIVYFAWIILFSKSVSVCPVTGKSPLQGSVWTPRSHGVGDRSGESPSFTSLFTSSFSGVPAVPARAVTAWAVRRWDRETLRWCAQDTYNIQ